MKHTRTFQDLAAVQVENEIEMKQAGIERFEANNQRAVAMGNNAETEWNNVILQNTIEPLSKALEAYIDYYTGRRGKESAGLRLLKAMKSREAAFVTIREALNIMVNDVPMSTAVLGVGQKLEDQVRFAGLHANAPKFVEKVMERLAQNNTNSYKHKKAVLANAEKSLAVDFKAFGKDEKAKAGAIMLELFIKHTHFNGAPVLEKVTFFSRKTKKKETSFDMTPEAKEWVRQFKMLNEVAAPAYAPCVIKPRDWTAPDNGGYHVEDVAKTLPICNTRKRHLRRLTKEQMPVVYQALNGLQAVRWTVSEKILDVAQAAFDGELPIAMPDFKDIDVGPAPLHMHPELMEQEYKDGEPVFNNQGKPVPRIRGKAVFEFLETYGTTEEMQDYRDWLEARAAAETQNKKSGSDVVKMGKTLAMAQKYRSFEDVHFVYTLDFRGRVYCQSTNLSPQGDDIQKALLRFSEGMALGEEGMYWLAVQGAGVWAEETPHTNGKKADKIDFDSRVVAIEEMSDDICAYAEDPLNNRGWCNADKPWQFLNFCFEWAELCKWVEAGNEPEDFVSYLAVAMDGSCSGIQHYSAMLRDEIGGEAVNLRIGNVDPQDIYGRVATVLTKKLEEIVSRNGQGSTLASQWLNIKGGITRGLCKTPVMTLPYGSTRITCRESISDYVKDLVAKEFKRAKAEDRAANPMHSFDTDKEMHEALSYLTPLLWESIGEVVKAARLGMQFIKQVAKAVSDRNSRLEWITPTGMIVEQTIFCTKSRQVKAQLLGETKIRIREETTTIDSRKMQTSAAPNFVHSMDASHLVLAVAAFLNAGIGSIAVIHDSFGTHAGRTGELRKLLVDSFVDMYIENDVLEDLMMHNEERLCDDFGLDAEMPEKMNLDLEETRISPFAFA